MKLNIEEVRKIVKSLRNSSIAPKCPKHEPKFSFYDGVVMVSCPNCKFVGFMPVTQYEALLNDKD